MSLNIEKQHLLAVVIHTTGSITVCVSVSWESSHPIMRPGAEHVCGVNTTQYSTVIS